VHADNGRDRGPLAGSTDLAKGGEEAVGFAAVHGCMGL
jgi:hypothetical protein